jgi:hypothetical protein
MSDDEYEVHLMPRSAPEAAGTEDDTRMGSTPYEDVAQDLARACALRWSLDGLARRAFGIYHGERLVSVAQVVPRQEIEATVTPAVIWERSQRVDAARADA